MLAFAANAELNGNLSGSYGPAYSPERVYCAE
jgi:hypothetical protein